MCVVVIILDVVYSTIGMKIPETEISSTHVYSNEDEFPFFNQDNLQNEMEF